jgi:hypothetical protein
LADFKKNEKNDAVFVSTYFHSAFMAEDESIRQYFIYQAVAVIKKYDKLKRQLWETCGNGNELPID